jgi:hypothetical protein
MKSGLFKKICESGKPSTMSIEQSQREALPSLFKSSHRTLAEQSVGLGILLLLCSVTCLFVKRLAPLSGLSALLYAVSFWTLWRRNSLRLLKLELTLFIAQIALNVGWVVTFFFLQHKLLALFVLLLLWCNTLLMTILYWKKERLAGFALSLPSLWVFYLLWLNIVVCMNF